jgi:hypothetical protein
MWIIHNQFGRRNLPPFARAELALKLEPLFQKTVKYRGNGSDHHQVRAAVAKAAGLGQNSIQLAKAINRDAPEPVKAALRAGETTINRAAPLFPGLSFARNTQIVY